MPPHISIKNERTERLARQLASLTGETITHAIETAVAERYARLRRARARRSLGAELTEIACGVLGARTCRR